MEFLHHASIIGAGGDAASAASALVVRQAYSHNMLGAMPTSRRQRGHAHASVSMAPGSRKREHGTRLGQIVLSFWKVIVGCSGKTP
jgi:hypothetical protein